MTDALLYDLNPMTTLGYELQSRGHRVTVVGILDAEKKSYSAGLEPMVKTAKLRLIRLGRVRF